MSDGAHFRSAHLAIDLNQLIESQELSALCVIKMKDFAFIIDQEGYAQVAYFFIFLTFIYFFCQSVLHFRSYCY